MLIPFLSLEPGQAAAWVPPCYVQKLQQECWQMLRGAAWWHGNQAGPAPGYAHHPFTRWVATSEWAWLWVKVFALSLAYVEHPHRFPEQYDCATGERKPSRGRKRARDRGEPEPLVFGEEIYRMVRPPSSAFHYHTLAETPLCPLPRAAAIIYPHIHPTRDHELRITEFHAYMAMHKNGDRTIWLYEYRHRPRPPYMPPRTPTQQDLHKKHCSRVNHSGTK